MKRCYIAVSNPPDCSKRFTLTCSMEHYLGFYGKNAAIDVRRIFVQQYPPDTHSYS